MSAPVASTNAATLATVRFPFRQDSVYYRAYAETVAQQTVLDWALKRLTAGLPPGIRIVGICSTRRELDLLTRAYTGSEVTFAHCVEPSEVHQCQALMRDYGVSRIIELKLGHAMAPVATLLRKTLKLHEAVGATLTEVAATAFPATMFVIEAEAVHALASANIPVDRTGLLDAADCFRAQQHDPAQAALAAHWIKLDFSDILNIPRHRWPETIALENAAHIRILRHMLAQHGCACCCDDHYIDAWKTAAIAVPQLNLERSLPLAGDEPRRISAVQGRRARVLYISVTSYFHGAAQSLCHLIGGLDMQRFEPFAVVSFDGILTDELRRRGVTVICPNQTLRATDAAGLAFAIRLVREIAPDIAHCNFDIGVPLAAALAAANVPVVQHIRSLEMSELSLEIHGAAAIIAISDLTRRRLAECDVDPNLVEVIYNGVDLDGFRPIPGRKYSARQELGLPHDDFVVATIGRMTRRKCHETVVRAVAELRRQTGRGHLLLVAAQDGERAYYEEVRSLIRREGLDAHHTHIEFTKDVPTVLHASNCLALMARDEALGRVALEAMAVGRPVIVGDSTGAMEVLEHGVNGFVLPYKSVASLTSTLALLAADPLRAEQIGVAAARTIQTSLSSAHYAKRTMDVYERVLVQRRAATNS